MLTIKPPKSSSSSMPTSPGSMPSAANPLEAAFFFEGPSSSEPPNDIAALLTANDSPAFALDKILRRMDNYGRLIRRANIHHHPAFCPSLPCSLAAYVIVVNERLDM